MTKKINGLIYVAECKVNGKRYVGQTVRTFEKRQQQHKSDSKRLNNHFYNAIRKYGWDSFTWAIIVEGVDIIDSLNELEQYWIAELDTFNNGYNSNIGGGSNVGFKMTEEQKKKSSIAHKGMILPEEVKRKISEARKGIIFSEEHRQKLSEAKKCKTGAKNPRSKVVICFDIGTEFVEVFAGMAEAERYTGVSNSNIAQCCKGYRKTAGGYLWKCM